MNDVCLLIKALAATGPTPVPWQQCCTAAIVALHDQDQPDGVWLCPLEENENELAFAPRQPKP
jgi:hypothetical protein